MGREFVHLHLHSQYSLLDGAIRFEELFPLLETYGMKAVALTDHGNMFGAIEFYHEAKKHGIKPILGCEVYVAPKNRFEKDGDPFHLILLATDAQGYRNLSHLVSLGYLEGFYHKPRIDWELLERYNRGLIALTSCLKGEIPSLLLQGRYEEAKQRAGALKELFDEGRFYLELQDNGLEEQKRVNEGLVRLSRELGVKVVATNDCHYLRRSDALLHDVLLCIQTGKNLQDPKRLRFSSDQFHLRPPEEMEALFSHVPEAVKNTLEVAERCELELQLGQYHLPHFEPPGGASLEDYLRELATHGLRRRLSERKVADADPYWKRLSEELQVINSMGFAGYFLIVADFVNYAKERGIPVGPGRGSAAGSLVAYALRITDIDPLEHGLLFERFLNPERVSLPDIDVDFCYECRDEVIRYVMDKYGHDKVAQIITFGKMQARAVVRDVGRVLGLPYREVDLIAKLIPAGPNVTLREALEVEPRLKEMAARDERVAQLLEFAQRLEGMVRHASTHAAGVVIANRPLMDYLPLYRAPGGEVTTQFAMKDVERIGLVKFDFLGLKTLTMMRRIVDLVAKRKGEVVELNGLPLDDEETYQLLSSGDTTGVFQLESQGMRELLRKLKPSTFKDLVALVALYRPGPLGSGMVEDFIKRRHRKGQIRYPHPALKEVLEETYGVIVYQEQVMMAASRLADFSLGEADLLRRAMSKKDPQEMARLRERFVEGAVRKGVDRQKASEIFDLMAKFAEYGFNKSHSAAYALVAYQTAYLKAHYPQEFMAALLTADMDNSDKVMRYITECREKGIEVLPPDVNHSSWEFTVEGDCPPKIRYGLGAIKNVGRQAVEAILEAREGGPFRDLFDFCRRVDSRRVNRRAVESLIKAGAF
ncbi:MAG: DNA polymerase III subunit alpha, partial [Deltaproteobacteria bacterium]